MVGGEDLGWESRIAWGSGFLSKQVDINSSTYLLTLWWVLNEVHTVFVPVLGDNGPETMGGEGTSPMLFSVFVLNSC